MELDLRKQKLNYSQIITTLIVTWLMANILFPGNFTLLKIMITGLLCVLSFADVLFKNQFFNKRLLKGIFLFLLFSICSLSIGNYYDFKIDFSIIEVYILRPITLLFIVSMAEKYVDIRIFEKLIFYCYFFLVLYNLLYMLGSFNFIPNLFFWETQNVVIQSDDFLASRLTNQAALIFLFPVITYITFKGQNKKSGIIYLFFILGIVVSLLSGRRILQIICLLSICLIPFLKKSRSLKSLLNFYIFIFFSIFSSLAVARLFSYAFQVDSFFETVWSTIENAFDNQTYSSKIRQEQVLFLFSEWKNYLFFGSGLNSYVRSFIRSINTPWSYEFVYVAFLFQTGISGVVFFTTLVIRILSRLIKTVSTDSNMDILKGIALGSVCFFVGGSTNPMIASVWFWFIFLYAFVYSYKIEDEK